LGVTIRCAVAAAFGWQGGLAALITPKYEFLSAIVTGFISFYPVTPPGRES